jgi:hypothetical protein
MKGSSRHVVTQELRARRRAFVIGLGGSFNACLIPSLLPSSRCSSADIGEAECGGWQLIDGDRSGLVGLDDRARAASKPHQGVRLQRVAGVVREARRLPAQAHS